MIELKNVSKYYSNSGNVTLGLRNINLSLHANEIVAITGDSGAGKSTLLNVITGVDTYEEGEIYFFGNETSYFNHDDMDLFLKNNVSFVFQNYNIIDSYSVLENVMLPLLLSGKTLDEAKTKALEIIEKVGLKKRAHNKGTKLSGGEKQRCVIARALASNARILACDEPTGNLDSETGNEIIQLIKEVAKDKLVLIVTHNYAQVEDIITRRITVADGEIIEDVCLKDTPAVEEIGNLDLAENKMRFPSFLKLVFENIFSTPKKTIFSSLVLMVVSFVTLVLCLLALQYSYESGYNENKMYNYLSKDRLIAYDIHHNALNKEALASAPTDEYYYNSFYEETSFIVSTHNNVKFATCYTKHQMNYELVRGEEINYNDDEINEFIAVFPASYNSRQLSEIYMSLNKMFYYGPETSSRYHYEIYFGNMVGVALSDEIFEPYVVLEKEPQNLISFLINRMANAYFETTDGEMIEMYSSTSYISRKSYISCPTYLEGKFNYEFLIGDLYPVSYDLEIIYEDRLSAYTPTFVIQNDFLEGELKPTFDEVYEVSFYTSNVDKLRQHLNSYDISVTIPARYEQNTTLNYVYLYVFIALIVVALISLFFISYVVLSRIYASKNKDYGIMRTLGMVRNQLKWMVILELSIIGFLSAVLSLVLFIILYFATNLLTMGDYLSAILCLIYLLTMIIFSIFIARRFNKRLYKFSINTTLKGEVARND